MFNARFLVDWIEFFKDIFNLDFLDSELHDIVEGDSVEDNDVKALSTQVVESIIMDLLTKIPFKDEIIGYMKEKSNEGMQPIVTFCFLYSLRIKFYYLHIFFRFK